MHRSLSIRPIAAALAFAGAVFASAPSRSAPLPDDCMPLSEVKAGMIGEAKSVVSGFDLASYKVEILGIERGAIGGSSMILAKLEGPLLENHGIVAGMSGSPVYINGKIIGAVAYGWGFAYKPYGGITPIEDMFSAWDDLDKPPPVQASAAGAGSSSSSAAWAWEPAWDSYSGDKAASAPQPVSFTPRSAEAVAALGPGPVEMMPLSSPIFVSSASPRTRQRLEGYFASRGLDLLAGGSGAGSDDKPGEPSPPMVAGSAIGIPFMTGDLSLGGIGTVTYRRGNKLLAFGHPMFNEGATRFPMAPARIFGIMQSYSRSFKMGESREVVGTVRQDRAYCIGGVFGEAPPRFDMTVRAAGDGAFNPRDFHFSVWRDRNLGPMLAGTALDESYTAAVAATGELTSECRYSIKLAGGREVKKAIHASSPDGNGAIFLQSIARDMFLLLQNPFKEAEVASIDIDLTAKPGAYTDILQAATPRRTTLKPGDEFEIDTLWQRVRGEQYHKREAIRLPANLREGTYVIHLADSRAAMMIDQRHAPGDFAPRDLEGVIGLAQRLEYPMNRLKLYLFEPEVGIGLNAKKLEGLPDSIETLVSATAPADQASLTTGRLISSQSSDYEYPLQGRMTFAVNVTHYLPE